ncbi:sensor histidine kinase [Cyclobacterium marinum]|uniref:Putative signal transduction histidine kinase n=1 Tax=Cyclobacterium marinum (strain ATCC 25205 / DSM 745 / LMG 13164 / NCIMB 1802) TaxID=880070 RepID=G0IVB6_CYCMS|nr:histidine kinase [Cyclobacterium marinum]AEL27915.1 putative signal transduction histidine kinase [Cyclobacterium marinum DSM 745]
MEYNKKITAFSHLLVWFVLFSMPYVLSYGQEQELTRVIAHFWIPLVFYAIIFYVNYFLFIDRFLFEKKMLEFIGVNIILLVLLLWLREGIDTNFFADLARKPHKEGDNNGPSFKMFIYVQLLSYMAPLIFAIAIKTTQQWVKTEAESKEAANYKLKTELQHLHYQLQPHFFFNSLNNIYSLVDISPEEAKKSIHSLSKLMRYMLYETNLEKVPISKEIEFMKKYIELMKLRVSEKTKVNYHFPTINTGITVAPLLFISLIENAFKHGISARSENLIDIEMKLDNDIVVFKIENDNFPKKVADKSGSGIGLQNLEKRLQLLYPNKYQFKHELIDDRFLVTLIIETG